MAVVNDETPRRRARRGRGAGAAGRCASGRSTPGSASSTRPRSSPPPASWPATRSIRRRRHVRLEALERRPQRGLRLTFEDQGPGIADIDAGADATATPPATGSAWGSAAPSGWSTSSTSHRGPAKGRGHDRAMEVISQRLESADRQPASAKRAAWPASCRARPGWATPSAASVALVVTEAATNLVKHAGGGELLLRRSAASTRRASTCWRSIGARAFAIWPRRCATASPRAGTPGNGLGAIAPPRDRCSISTRAPASARPSSRASGAGAPAPPDDDGMLLGSINVPYPGESVSRRRLGGAAQRAAERRAGRRRPRARHSGGRGGARRRCGVSQVRRGGAAARSSAALHEALRPTRGAAVAVAEIDSRPAVGPFRRARQHLRHRSSLRRQYAQHRLASRHRRTRHAPHPGIQLSLARRRDPGAALGRARARWTLDNYPGLQRSGIRSCWPASCTATAGAGATTRRCWCCASGRA